MNEFILRPVPLLKNNIIVIEYSSIHSFIYSKHTFSLFISGRALCWALSPMLRAWSQPSYMQMNKFSLSLPLPFMRKQEIMVYELTRGDSMPWPWKRPGASSVSSRWAFWSVMLQCVCLLVCTECHAAWDQNCCMKSYRFAFLLRVWSRGSSITWELGRNAKSPALPRLPESQSMQYNKTPLWVHAHYLKTQGEVSSRYALRIRHV